MAFPDFDELSQALSTVNAYAAGLGLDKKEAPQLKKQTSVEFDPYTAAISSTNSEVPRINAGGNDPLVLKEKMRAIKAA